jgi:hypothetical protein
VDDLHDREVSPAQHADAATNAHDFRSHLKLHSMETELMHMELAHLGSKPDSLLPLEVDDEFITEDEVLPQPANRLSLVAGLNALTAINKTLMESNVTASAISPQPYQSNDVGHESGRRLGTCQCGREVTLTGPLAAAHERLHKLERCLDDLPPELAAERGTGALDSQPEISALLQSQYETMRANLHVTHVWAQNSLVELIIALSENEIHASAFLETKKHCSRFQEDLARKLLKVLDTLPKVSLLPNGLTMVSEDSTSPLVVRFDIGDADMNRRSSRSAPSARVLCKRGLLWDLTVCTTWTISSSRLQHYWLTWTTSMELRRRVLLRLILILPID